jgi:hypothetical protein
MMAVAGFRARLLPFAGRISSSGQSSSAAISISAAAFSFTLTNNPKTTIACRVYQTTTFLLSTKAQGATPSLPGTE